MNEHRWTKNTRDDSGWDANQDGDTGDGGKHSAETFKFENVSDFAFVEQDSEIICRCAISFDIPDS